VERKLRRSRISRWSMSSGHGRRCDLGSLLSITCIKRIGLCSISTSAQSRGAPLQGSTIEYTEQLYAWPLSSSLDFMRSLNSSSALFHLPISEAVRSTATTWIT
jgi:hypothetical protein